MITVKRKALVKENSISLIPSFIFPSPLSIVDSRLSILDCRFSIVDCRFSIVDCRLSNIFSPLSFLLLLLLPFSSCILGGGYEKAENAQDAGREFIRATLDGDHQKARFYLLQDTTNLLLIDRQQKNYQQLNSEEKRKHRESNIYPVSIQKVNDSTTNYTYYNSYNPRDTTMIRIVKSDGNWLVDLKSILKD